MTDELIGFYQKYTRKDCVIQKLPMTVDFERFVNLKINPTEKYIAYVGSLSNEKDGIDLLIASFVQISNKHDIKLRIAGGTPEQILKLKEKLQLKNNILNKIEFLGLLPIENIPNLLINAMILVLPRPDSLQARGGFPTKLGEYLATGNPVIATRVGEIPKFLTEDEIFLISPNNIEKELAQKISEIYLNYGQAIAMAKKAKIKAFQSFSTDANANKVKELILKLSK